MFTIDQKTIYLPDAGLYLDSRKRRKFGFASHAHADHLASHDQILASPATCDLARLRTKAASRLIPLEYDTPYEINQGKITLYPAGHILGSAQLIYESDGRKLLYSGDYRPGKSHTVEDAVIPRADVLIMETTFGRPHYVFPPREEVEAELVAIVREKLAAGMTPVVFGYSLGKGQELMHVLSNAGLPLAVEYSILRFVRIYQKYGVTFGPHEKFRRSEPYGKVLLLPAHQRSMRYIQRLENTYKIYMSGWAVDEKTQFRLGVDRALPYSDHADFNELMQYVGQVGAEEVYCTHGFDDFVTILKQRGVNAQKLIPGSQLELFD